MSWVPCIMKSHSCEPTLKAASKASDRATLVSPSGLSLNWSSCDRKCQIWRSTMRSSSTWLRQRDRRWLSGAENWSSLPTESRLSRPDKWPTTRLSTRSTRAKCARPTKTLQFWWRVSLSLISSTLLIKMRVASGARPVLGALSVLRAAGWTTSCRTCSQTTDWTRRSGNCLLRIWTSDDILI